MAMIAGDFEYLSDEKDEIIRVWTTKNNKDRAKYIVDFAVRALRVIENLTDLTYISAGWQKINFVAVPNISPVELRPGGLVIINQNYIYANNITIENKEKIFNHITRLYIDQWLMKSMDYNHNKENLSKYDFEQYLKDFMIDKVEKSWRMMDIIFLNEHSHPFEYDNYYNIYETETYAVSHYKYEFLIRMIRYILGERKYKSALQSYLQNGSDLSDELIKAYGDENGNFEKALKDWLNKTNYPILTISRNYTTQQALFTQMTFLINRTETSSDRYWIPINCATEDNPDFLDTRVTYWFDPSLASLEILAPQNDKWLICNKQRFGIYHVNYDEKNWNLIINYLKSENYNKIHVLNRAQLIDDAFTLAEFGYLNYSIPLKLIGYINQEIDYIPWIAFWRQICRLHEFSRLKNSEYYDNFKRYVLKQTENIEKRLISDETPTNNLSKKLARKLLMKWTCKFGSNLCKNYTLDKLQKWLEDSEENPIPAELKQEILCGGIRHADQDIWNKLLQKYLSNGDADIVIALSCTSNDEILKNFTMSNINDTWGRLESSKSKFQIIFRKNDIGVDVLLDLIDSNKLASSHFKNYRYDDREVAINQANHMKTEYQFDKASNDLKCMKKN
ncbi:aminopeptidase N-like [Microplitis mediator]|uniref:aminopeptidase N-like n=1 Tax=Microplitis mediator TaxID=375433 RepID=UPI002555AF95|nr:aminopeptidase N-like [Microplitis mediator]